MRARNRAEPGRIIGVQLEESRPRETAAFVRARQFTNLYVPPARRSDEIVDRQAADTSSRNGVDDPLDSGSVVRASGETPS